MLKAKPSNNNSKYKVNHINLKMHNIMNNFLSKVFSQLKRKQELTEKEKFPKKEKELTDIEKLLEYLKNRNSEDKIDLRNGNYKGINLNIKFLNESYFNDLDIVRLRFIDLSGSDFSDSNLSDVKFESSNLSDCNLSNSNLRGACMTAANLTNCNLSNSDLSSAELNYANLSNANLRKAKLYETLMEGTNFTGADLTDSEAWASPWLISLVLKNVGSAKFKEKIDWVVIPSGTFLMGSPLYETNREENESQHQVTLGAYKISKYEVTIGQFKTFIDATGYVTDAEKGTMFKGSFVWNGQTLVVKEGVNWKCNEKGNLYASSEYNNPVTHVSWNDAKAFAEWMSCSLPTEAEWEYACRAGTTTPFNTGDNLYSFQANYDGNFPYQDMIKGEFRGKTISVGSLEPNAWGLYDMHGNVAEWCNDYFEDNYSLNLQSDPIGPENGEYRVFRNGSWFDDASDCRSASRGKCYQHFRLCSIGFRLVSIN
jgi:formylglycine-generating enzyme required for sulfatase activity